MSGVKSIVIAASVIVATCGGSGEQQGEVADTAVNDTSDIRGMEGMSTGESQTMMQEMQSHMQLMESARGDSLRNMATMHRQMAANMLAQMNRDMQQMNMAADAKWNALADSVRQDLTGMAEWNMQQMNAAMPAHMSRMRRLMDMHSAMMR
jgi:hypothetical protein